jgi:hypothetical protein
MIDKISFNDGDFKMTEELKKALSEISREDSINSHNAGTLVGEILSINNNQELSVENLESGYRITHTSEEFDIVITGNSADYILAKILNDVFGIEVDGL